MALIPMNHPDIDRIIERDYEAYTDRLYDEYYGDHGERCSNCEYFVSAYGDLPAYCNIDSLEDIEDDDEFIRKVEENATDPEGCCEKWEWNMIEDEPEEEW